MMSVMNESKTGEMGELARLMELLTQSTERLGRSYETIARLQQALAEKDRQLAQKTRLEMLGRMAAGLAHEIRNPLGGIALYANLLKRDLAGEPEKVETLSKILGAVMNLNRLVEDMLTFGGTLQPVKAVCPVHRVVDEALTLVRGEIEARGISVVRDAALDLAVPMDAGMMQRVFLNLLLNAAQAMEGGGTLEITAARAEGEVEIAVRDRGPGIQDLEKIFTPFYTTRTKGTGLGLAIAQKIVEAHGGRITAENPPGGGARFGVRLPCRES